MKFFIDTAEVSEIKSANELGLVDGVTTNPSLIAKSGRDFKEVVTEITEIVDGPQQPPALVVEFFQGVSVEPVAGAIAELR